MRRDRPDLRPAVIISGALGVGTLVVAALERLGVADASSAYLLAIVVVAVLSGIRPALTAAVGAFLLYDVLFIEPRYTLTVTDPQEWLNLLLLLVVGLVVGRLAGRERDRAEGALAQEREARALFRVSASLAGAPDTRGALPDLLAVIQTETEAERAWVDLGPSTVADTGARSGSPPRPSVYGILRRRPGDASTAWTRVHAPATGRNLRDRDEVKTANGGTTSDVFRVDIADGDRSHGAIWVARRARSGDPSPGDTRVLVVAADQIAAALVRDRLRADATAAEIARRGEVLKSALLDSVSHDLRTPLAAIRAAAGTLMDPSIEWPADERREIARSIDREATWLDRLVSNLLDMSRVEAGELRPDAHVFDLADLVDAAVARIEGALGTDRLTVEIPDDLAPVRVDEVFLVQILANLLDNAAKYAGPDAPIRVSARQSDAAAPVVLVVEDGGPGVDEEHLQRLFEKFYRVPRPREGSRRGTGIGLSVVRGLAEAMGGAITARRSELGGLAIHVTLPSAPIPGAPT